MKRIALACLACALSAGIVFAQGYDSAPMDDRTQEEKNLEILSKKLVRMKKEMDKFVKDMGSAYSPSQDDPMMGTFGSNVNVDIVDNEKSVVVTADLPGMEKDKIDITLESGRILRISGMRHIEKKVTSPGVVRQERMEGRFERALELPAECRSDGITASYKNGVLEITIPKKEAAKPDLVKVKVV